MSKMSEIEVQDLPLDVGNSLPVRSTLAIVQNVAHELEVLEFLM
jgi:hypothetical protein